MMLLRSLSVACVFGVAVASGADWPTYRHDARRSGCAPDALPAALALRWTQHLPTYEMAFPNEARQQFDPSHEPVCAAGILVVGSPADGSVRAFAAETGKELWRFHAEGPVRLAPVLHDGRVLFGADDGQFYCLDLKTGRPLWQRAAFPKDRPDVRLLGNNRLISHWPVRGGAVVVDDTVYFGSGVWPTMGVYVQALDVRTGERRWQNDKLGYLANVRIDHNLRYDAGISPQGYLLATKDRLIVPNGRSHPVALNRADGSLFHFVQGYRNGHCQVVLGGNYAFAGKNGVLGLADFREVGSKWQDAGKDAPNGFVYSKLDQYEGPYHPYKKFPGCDADSVFDGDTAYSLANGIFYTHTLADSGVSEYEIAQGTRKLKPFRWDARMTLRVTTGLSGKTRLFAKAGNTLYGRAGNRVVALQVTGKRPPISLVMDAKVEALPTSMIVAQDRLFVALADGSLLCFGAGAAAATDLAEKPEAVPPVASPELKALLAAKVPQEGIALILGGLNAGETEFLLANTKLRLIVGTDDAAEVEAERRRVAASGVYGFRVERLKGKPLALRLPAYLASSLWLRGSDLGVPTGIQLGQAWTSVHPYGGALCYTGTLAQCTEFATLAKAAQLPGAKIAASGSSVKISRPDGPVGAADWTHETADPARSYFSKDRAVRAPLAPLWYGDGPAYGFIKSKDYGRGVKPQVVEGRVFALQQRSRRLFAYDAYTGRLIWSTQGEGKDKGFITRFASMPDGIYVAGKGRCVVYDPATGKELRRMDFAGAAGKGQPARAAAVVVSEKSVLVAVSAYDTGAIEKGLWDADALVCFDRKTGTIRWQRVAQDRFNTKALAIADGSVFCTDSLSPVTTEKSKRRGEGVKECISTVMALNELTGKERWQHQHRAAYHKNSASSWLSTRGKDDWVAYATETKQLLAGRDKTTLLLDGETGNVVWEKPIGLSQPVVIMGDKFLDQGARFVKLATGESIKNDVFRRGGCNYAVANAFLAFVRDQTVCYIDLESGERHRLRNMRSGCSNSLVAASGVLSIPNFAQGCVCNYPVQTTSAWIHQPEADAWAPAEAFELKPLIADTGIAKLDPAAVATMHAFKRRFLVEDPALADKHLLAHWGFDNVAGKTAPNLSGPKAACQLSNPSFEAFGTGQALRCGGWETKTKGSAVIEPSGCIQDALTFAAWVKIGPEQHKGSGGVFERPQFYRLMIGETKPPYSIGLSVQTTSGWRSVSTPRSIQADQWVHIAGTYDGEVGESVMYINGKQVAKNTSRPGRIRPVSCSIAVGVRDGLAYLSGALDEIRIYNRALGPKAIAPLAKQP